MAHQKTNYTQGYSKASIASHASRTVESDASFLIPHINPTDSILDVGCGPGTITVGFATLAPQGSATGVDISDQVLQEAAKVVAKTCNITFQRADLLSESGLPFRDNTFDIVFNSQLFPHLPTHELRLRALTEMRRVLKPGGILASRDAAHLHFYPLPDLSDPESQKYDLNRLWAGNMIKALRGGDGSAHLPGGDMPALFLEAGFAGDKVRVGAGTTVHAGAEVRRWFVDACKGRLEAGEVFRESWKTVGVTDEGIELTREALDRWAEDEGGWYVAVQAEILGWK